MVEFASTLLALKQDTGRGYRELARHVHVSTAALHRYCVGKALPPDFTLVRRLARLHGVPHREVDHLYQLRLKAQLDNRR